jgi:glucose 1-dehydrogenase
VPVGRLIEPEEVAAQIVHLCDPDNRHMTGSTVLMDGGLSLFGTGVFEGRE